MEGEKEREGECEGGRGGGGRRETKNKESMEGRF